MRITSVQLGSIIPVCVAIVVVGCSTENRDTPTSTPSEASHKIVTRADSAAALGLGSRSFSLSSVVSGIALNAGESVVITVMSTDCSGDPETVAVSGVIVGAVVSAQCGVMTGSTITMGPATSNGTISFTATHQEYGQGPSGQVTGSRPDFVVGMNDGYPGDADYNDVVISVHIVCPLANDPILDHPDFKRMTDSIMKLSNLSAPAAQRREWGYYVWEDPLAPGGLRLGPEFIGGTAECSTGTVGMNPAIKFIVHSHPHFKGEKTYCGKSGREAYDPNFNGGGSDADWSEATRLGLSIYAVSPEEIHRMDWDVPVSQRTSNTLRWRKQSACFVYKP